MQEKDAVTLAAFKDMIDEVAKGFVESGYRMPIATHAFVEGLDKEDLYEALCYASEQGVTLDFIRDYPEMEQDYHPHNDPKEQRIIDSVDLFSNPVKL